MCIAPGISRPDHREAEVTKKMFFGTAALGLAGATAGVPMGAMLCYFGLSDLWAMLPLSGAAVYFLSRFIQAEVPGSRRY
jgi:hypothetical protein